MKSSNETTPKLGPDIEPKRVTAIIDWISTGDERPDTARTVLVFHPLWRSGTVWMGFREPSGLWRDTSVMKLQPAPTHWAELPEGPAK